MLRLGLTGGIGSGKSTVAGMLAQRGATVIDADALSRRHGCGRQCDRPDRRNLRCRLHHPGWRTRP
jgi:broad-specificity NMP kinase